MGRNEGVKETVGDFLKARERLCIEELEMTVGKLKPDVMKIVRFAFASGMSAHKDANEVIGRVFKHE